MMERRVTQWKDAYRCILDGQWWYADEDLLWLKNEYSGYVADLGNDGPLTYPPFLPVMTLARHVLVQSMVMSFPLQRREMLQRIETNNNAKEVEEQIQKVVLDSARIVLDKAREGGVVWSCSTERSLREAKEAWEVAIDPRDVQNYSREAWKVWEVNNDPRDVQMYSHDPDLYKRVPPLSMGIILPPDDAELWRTATELFPPKNE